MTKDDVSRSTIEKGIDYALIHLYKNDGYLLENNLHEQCVAFRFGLYFEDFARYTFGGSFDVDMEYNKNKGQEKRLFNDEYGKRPDLIVHERGSNDNNVLIVEFKKGGNCIRRDFRKVKRFCSKRGEYKYKHGVCISFGETKDDCQVVWVTK